MNIIASSTPAATTAQEVEVPSVVRYLPELPDCAATRSVPLYFRVLPDARLMCSEEVHESVASTQLKVLSVAPLSVIPPPSAVTSEGVATSPRTIFLSSTARVVELIVVVVPFTVKSPERVRLVPVAAPMSGVTRVGVLANTNAPVPVSPVTAAAKFEEEGVAKKVATPVPSPSTPVDIGSPVAFVRTPEAGVPSAGVVIVGDVKVLFVRVSVPASVATSASLIAVFNCARVDVTVFEPSEIDLFENVVVDDAVTEISLVSATVPVASGRVIVLSAVGSVT